jgi:[ribosomal protein S5]-alanine N-acetyltransferase
MTVLNSEKIGGLFLRPWSTKDRDSIVKYANNRNVSINLRDRFPYPYTLKDADYWIEIANSHRPICNFAIEADGHAVGGIGLVLGEDVFRCTAELGYWIGEPFWGRGIATEAVKLATEYGFSQFNLVRIHAGAFSSNPASARVLEKAGYLLEARMRKSIIKEGKILDQLNYVVVR